MTIAGERGASALLASVGLLADGPALWGRPITTKGPGLYAVELPAPLPHPPIELTRVGKWIERVPSLRLDGERPTSKALAGRLASLWLPATPVLYVGATDGSVGGRVIALAHHVLGDRRPHADGHWLHLLTGIEHARVWWARTDAPEEYFDAVLDAFAATAGAVAEGRPPAALLLPWANLRRPTGERQASGITGSILADETPAPPPAGSRVVTLPAGDADGARVDDKGTGTRRRTGDPTSLAPAVRPSRPAPAHSPAARSRPAAQRQSSRPEPVHLTQDALDRLKAELADLTKARRPEVVARIKAARELGDLKENSEYHAAREEQSFLEGRIRTLDDRIRNAVVFESSGGAHVVMGSVVTIEPVGYADAEAATYTIVGSTEADPRTGRISSASPVGAALLGAAVGDEVEVRTPRGAVRYRVTALD